MLTESAKYSLNYESKQRIHEVQKDLLFLVITVTSRPFTCEAGGGGVAVGATSPAAPSAARAQGKGRLSLGTEFIWLRHRLRQ